MFNYKGKYSPFKQETDGHILTCGTAASLQPLYLVLKDLSDIMFKGYVLTFGTKREWQFSNVTGQESCKADFVDILKC